MNRIKNEIHVIEKETETYTNNFESISTLEQFESVNSETTTMTSQSTNNILKNQQNVLAPDNPLMERIQNILKLQLLKQTENIKKEILTLVRKKNIFIYVGTHKNNLTLKSRKISNEYDVFTSYNK